MQPLRLAMVPMMPSSDIDANAHRICDLAEQAGNAGCRMVCFPEAALTGYTTDSPQAVRIGDLRIAEIADMSEDVTIVFGFIEKADDGMYITQAVCQDGDVLGTYRKTHLGMREEKVFKAGDSLPMFDTENGRIGIALCWESHFPEIAGTLADKGAEIVLMPAASNLDYYRRMASWRNLLPTRASDNRVFVAACNFDGRAEMCASPDGTIMNGIQTDGFTIYDIDPELYDRYRTGEETMRNILYRNHRRPELYK
jgi:predicted amidohydrolase